MNDEHPIATAFDSFIDNLAGHETPDKLFFTAGIVELLRHSKSSKTGFALAELLASLPAVEWSRIPFSITKTILSDKYKKMVRQLGVPEELVTAVLLTGLCDFLAHIEEQPPTEDLLQILVCEIARANAEKPALSDAPKPSELFNHWMVKRVFDPAEIDDDTLTKIDAELVYFSAALANGHMGPDIRGLAFDNGTNQYFVLLESGEFVVVPKDYEHIRIVTKDVLFPDAPTALFLSACVAAQQLEMHAVISKPQEEFVAAGNLGKPLKPLVPAVASVEDIAALERVFDIGRESARLGITGATGPVGAIVRFPIPETDLIVVLDANQDSLGPYSTARLVRVNETGTETVLMRHETPRLYSLRGVYLFPLKDQLISLTVMF
jgi:hypothetical protein